MDKHPGVVLVLVGVVGVVGLDFKKIKTRRGLVRFFFDALLILGLILELREASKSDIEVASLTKQTQDLISSNLILSIELEKLKTTALTRRISPQQKEDFIKFTKDLPKFPVRIITAGGFGEPWNYARMVRDMLDAAHYEVKDGEGITEVAGLTHLTHIGDSTQDFPLSIGLYGKDSDALEWPGMTISHEGPYAIFKANKGAMPPPLLMLNSLNQIGVPTSFGSSAEYLKPGEWAIFIPKKY